MTDSTRLVLDAIFSLRLLYLGRGRACALMATNRSGGGRVSQFEGAGSPVSWWRGCLPEESHTTAKREIEHPRNVRFVCGVLDLNAQLCAGRGLIALGPEGSRGTTASSPPPHCCRASSLQGRKSDSFKTLAARASAAAQVNVAVKDGDPFGLSFSVRTTATP